MKSETADTHKVDGATRATVMTEIALNQPALVEAAQDIDEHDQGLLSFFKDERQFLRYQARFDGQLAAVNAKDTFHNSVEEWEVQYLNERTTSTTSNLKNKYLSKNLEISEISVLVV